MWSALHYVQQTMNSLTDTPTVFRYHRAIGYVARNRTTYEWSTMDT